MEAKKTKNYIVTDLVTFKSVSFAAFSAAYAYAAKHFDLEPASTFRSKLIDANGFILRNCFVFQQSTHTKNAPRRKNSALIKNKAH